MSAVWRSQATALPVSFAPPAAVPRSMPLGYRGSLGRDADLLPLGYAMRAAGVATSEVRQGHWVPSLRAIGDHWWQCEHVASGRETTSTVLLLSILSLCTCTSSNPRLGVPPAWSSAVLILSVPSLRLLPPDESAVITSGSALCAQGGATQDWFNMQAMARALSDDYGQQMQAPASVLSRASCDNASLQSIGNSFGGSAYGSMQSEWPIMSSPFNHTVRTGTVSEHFQRVVRHDTTQGAHPA